jgi:hypothetical protein
MVLLRGVMLERKFEHVLYIKFHFFSISTLLSMH